MKKRSRHHHHDHDHLRVASRLITHNGNSIIGSDSYAQHCKSNGAVDNCCHMMIRANAEANTLPSARAIHDTATNTVAVFAADTSTIRVSDSPRPRPGVTTAGRSSPIAGSTERASHAALAHSPCRSIGQAAQCSL